MASGSEQYADSNARRKAVKEQYNIQNTAAKARRASQPRRGDGIYRPPSRLKAVIDSQIF